MAEFGEENNNVFGGVEFEQPKVENAEGISFDVGAGTGEVATDEAVFKKVEAGNLPVKQSSWWIDFWLSNRRSWFNETNKSRTYTISTKDWRWDKRIFTSRNNI